MGRGASDVGWWGVGFIKPSACSFTIFFAPKGPKAGGQELEVSQIQVPLTNGAGRAGTGGRAGMDSKMRSAY